MLSRLSLKEGNQRIERSNKRKFGDLQPEIYYENDSKLNQVQSPVIMDSQEEPLQVQNIKSDVHYASGHKFDSSMGRVLLVKNLRRNGDFNEGIKEVTSSGSISEAMMNQSSRKKKQYEIINQQKPKQKYTSLIGDEYKKQNHKLEGKQIEQIKSILEYDNISSEEEKEQISGLRKKIKPLMNLESLKKASPMMTSSRRDTDRKAEIELQTLEIIASIRSSFNTSGLPPPTKIDFYKVGRVLGKGAFGKVNLAMHLLAKKLGKRHSYFSGHQVDQ